MVTQQFGGVNINLASKEELISVPRIGPVLAQRIIDARPYNRVDDLIRVQGINERLLAELEGYLSDMPVEAVMEATPAMEIIDDTEPEVVEVEPVPVTEAEITELRPESEEELDLLEVDALEAEESEVPEVVGIPPVEKPRLHAATPVPTEPPAPRAKADPQKIEKEVEKVVKNGPQRFEVLGYNLGFAILALLLAILLTLGVLAAVNGTLVYAPAGRFVEVERRMGMAEAQMDLMKEDAEGLRTRLDALEGLSGRVSDLEATTAAMRTELDTYEDQLAQLDERLLQLDERTAELEKSTRVFDEFLKGLKSLLLQIMPEDTGAAQPAK